MTLRMLDDIAETKGEAEWTELMGGDDGTVKENTYERLSAAVA